MGVFSAKLGKSAGSFVLVMSACRRWWNAALPLIPAPLEREILHPALEILLKCIVQTSSKAAPVEEQVTVIDLVAIMILMPVVPVVVKL